MPPPLPPSHTHSSFAAVHLPMLTPQQLDRYDTLINKPSNDWQLYYWLTGKEEAPAEYCSDVLELLKQHVQNPNREKRWAQPELKH